MAYISKKLYSIFQAKANQGDKTVASFLNQLNEMSQEEAEAQINMPLKGKKTPLNTNDTPTNNSKETSKDSVAEEATNLVDSGEYSSYDDAYNMLTKKSLRQSFFSKEVQKLPETYQSDDIIIQTLENAGFEVSKVEKDRVVVKAMGNEVSIPIERIGEQIKLRKEIK